MCMVFYHAMYTAGYMFDIAFARDMFWFFSYISPVFAFAFIMMCGISCTLSRNNLRRSIPILLAAAAVTLVSFFVMPKAPIIFGILHLLGTSILIYALTEQIFSKIPPIIGLIVALLLFFITYNVSYGYLGFENLFKFTLPTTLYGSNRLVFLGFIGEDKSYSDYFPLLPWIFAFFTGVFTGRLAKGRYPKFMYKSRLGFLSMLGTNAFIIYVIHQPIIFGVFYILTLIFGGN